MSTLDWILGQMSHGTLSNYIIPGLSSSLIGGGDYGMVRMFSCERNHQESVIPHSHRFDFTCLVIEGSVRNRLWRVGISNGRDLYQKHTLHYGGKPGEYVMDEGEPMEYGYEDGMYDTGRIYSMHHDEIHSIFFDKGTRVLFFEGPKKTDQTTILQPRLSNGQIVPTFKVEPWMFGHEA